MLGEMSRKIRPNHMRQVRHRKTRSPAWSGRPRKGRWKISPGAIAGLVAACAIAGFIAIERFPEYLGALPTMTALRKLEGTVNHVRDGDTIEVAEVPVRLGSLDCAERDTPAGRIATAWMQQLVAGISLTCALNGRTSHDRQIGSCALPDGRDLAALMIREGYCRRFW